MAAFCSRAAGGKTTGTAQAALLRVHTTSHRVTLGHFASQLFLLAFTALCCHHLPCASPRSSPSMVLARVPLQVIGARRRVQLLRAPCEDRRLLSFCVQRWPRMQETSQRVSHSLPHNIFPTFFPPSPSFCNPIFLPISVLCCLSVGFSPLICLTDDASFQNCSRFLPLGPATPGSGPFCKCQ